MSPSVCRKQQVKLMRTEILTETLSIVDGLVRDEPDAARFHEMRAQVGTMHLSLLGFMPLER